jgi:hypothetical protein
MNLIPDDTNTDELRKQVLEGSLKGVENFLNSYKAKAFDYVYEDDPQADLYVSIKKSLKKHQPIYDGEGWFISNNYPEKINKPCLVHCEQWRKYKCSDKGKGNYIDIAICDPVKENAEKHYKRKDLLLLIEIKYLFRAEDAIKAVKEDYKKLKKLKPEEKEYPKGLALTFTVAKIEKNKKLRDEGNIIDIDDVCKILNEKQFKENPIQALIVCPDGIIEIPNLTA